MRYPITREVRTLPGIFLVLLTVVAFPARAGDDATADRQAVDASQDQVVVAGDQKTSRFGITGAASNDGTYSDFTIGFEYERALSESFGIGTAVEYTGGDMDSLLIVAPITFRKEQWKLQAGPGFADSYRGRDFVLRFSGGYDFDFNDWIVTPSAKLDLIDEKEVVIFGVTIGTEF